MSMGSRLAFVNSRSHVHCGHVAFAWALARAGAALIVLDGTLEWPPSKESVRNPHRGTLGSREHTGFVEEGKNHVSRPRGGWLR